jgi:hypothetical protein
MGHVWGKIYIRVDTSRGRGKSGNILLSPGFLEKIKIEKKRKIYQILVAKLKLF